MSASNYYTTAVSIGDMKNAMLYFDHLIPVALPLEFANEIADGYDSFSRVLEIVTKEVLPKDLFSDNDFKQGFLDLNMSGYDLLRKLLIQQFNFPKTISGLSSKQYETIEDNHANEYFTFIKNFNLGDLPLISGNNTFPASFPEQNDKPTSAILTLSNLSLIDASNASWEQIIEFRKDPLSKAKLRKLRLFAYDNYTGKSKDYIEDDINSRIYNYEMTAAKFGLEVVQASLSNVMNSKLFAGITTGSLLATFFAEPSVSLMTISTGALIELGQFTLEFKRQQYQFENLVKDNPASYITYYNKQHWNESTNRQQLL